MSSRAKRIIKTILKFGLTAVALYFVFSQIAFQSVLKLIGGANVFWLLLAILLFTASKVVAAFRLNIFFRQAGLSINNTLNIKLYLLGMFYNLFLPGGIGGDGYKIYLLQKNYKTGTVKLFGAVLTDRLSGMTALAVLALILFSITDVPLNWNWAGYALVPFALGALFVFCRLFYRYFIPAFTQTTLLSMLVQLLQLFCAWAIIMALGGDEHLLPYLLVFLVSSIVAVLPVSIGGMGVRELTFLYGAQLLAIDRDLAVSISLVFYLITALVSFMGIWYVVRPLDFGEKG